MTTVTTEIDGRTGDPLGGPVGGVQTSHYQSSSGYNTGSAIGAGGVGAAGYGLAGHSSSYNTGGGYSTTGGYTGGYSTGHTVGHTTHHTTTGYTGHTSGVTGGHYASSSYQPAGYTGHTHHTGGHVHGGH